MDAIVDDVAGNNQSDRGDVQACGVSRIGSPRINRDQLAPIQLQIVSFERSATKRRSGISPGKRRRQKLSIQAGVSCSRMALTTSGVATALARGKRSRSDFSRR